jgi:hypothetical protein
LKSPNQNTSEQQKTTAKNSVTQEYIEAPALPFIPKRTTTATTIHIPHSTNMALVDINLRKKK